MIATGGSELDLRRRESDDRCRASMSASDSAFAELGAKVWFGVSRRSRSFDGDADEGDENPAAAGFDFDFRSAEINVLPASRPAPLVLAPTVPPVKATVAPFLDVDDGPGFECRAGEALRPKCCVALDTEK